MSDHSAEKDVPACDCESMGGRFGSHRPECPWQIAFEAQVAAEVERFMEMFPADNSHVLPHDK